MGSTLSKFIHSENILVRFLRYFSSRRTELEGAEEILNRIMDYHEGLGNAVCVCVTIVSNQLFCRGGIYR